jgi:calcineurin-like phosphoesterase family protein
MKQMKISLNKGQQLWFTSDTHYNHANICSTTTQWKDPVTCRDFKSLDEMNDTLVNNINAEVGQDDILFHLGDWSFGGFEQIEAFRNRIVCKNIHIITGNHDHHIERNKEGCQSHFSSVNKYLHLTVKRNVGTPLVSSELFVLMHFPIASWDQMANGAIHLHGHVHLPMASRIGPGKMMDVGVDGNGLRPISVSEIATRMRRQPIKSLMSFDHHESVEKYK